MKYDSFYKASQPCVQPCDYVKRNFPTCISLLWNPFQIYEGKQLIGISWIYKIDLIIFMYFLQKEEKPYKMERNVK